jgi:hypothetical protein
LIKLFIRYTLRFEQALKCCGALPKLEAACIGASFTEIGKEGYADDGLFSTMGEFFLPLTISEQEINQIRTTITDEALQIELERCTTYVENMKTSRGKTIACRQNQEKELDLLQQKMDQLDSAYVNNQSQVTAELDACKQTKGIRVTNFLKSRKLANELRRLEREWRSHQEKIKVNIFQCRAQIIQYTANVDDCDRQIDQVNIRIKNFQTELSQPKRPIDKGLVKPARGFIMYGPPGITSFFLLFFILKV